MSKLSHEGEQAKWAGWIQFVLVVLFIIGSFVVAKLLNFKDAPITKTKVERILVADVQTISPNHYQIQLEATGNVQARGEIGLVPQVSGRVNKVHNAVFTGANFKAGEVLFELEALEYQFAVTRLEAELARAQTSHQLALANTEAAKVEWQQLHGDKTPPALAIREPQLQEAKANLKAAQAQLEKAKLDLARTRFSLPFSGRILSSKLEQGQFVSAGQTYGQVYDLLSLEVIVSLKDQELAWLMQGKPDQISISTEHLGKQQTYLAYLKRGAAEIDALTRQASVSLGFKQVSDLVPGVFVKVQIKGPNLSNVLILPINALQKDGRIWALDQAQQLYELKGEVVFRSDRELVLSGVPQAVSVVTSRLPGAVSGMKIKATTQE